MALFKDRRELVTWQSRLDKASDERDVVSIAREFMAQFTPREIGSIPEECRPGKIVDAGDVTSCAFDLAKHSSHGDGESTISKVSAFFASASTRLSQIMDRRPGDGADSHHSN